MAALIVKSAHVLDPEGPIGVADIRIEDGRIAEIGPNLSGQGVEVIDATDMLAMPGLINSHTHSGQSLDRGTTPNLPLDLWVAWAVFGSVQRSPDDSYITAAAGALEMLQTGCTAVLDHVYLDPHDFENHAEAVVTAYEEVGLRAGVAPMVADRHFAESLPRHLVEDTELPDGPPFDPLMLIGLMEDFITSYQGRHERIIPMLGPSAPQRCSDDYLEMNADLANRYGVGIHTHLLETKSQALIGRARYGQSTVTHIRDLGLLGPRSSLAHVVWADSAEIALIAESGSTVVHNPWSNLRCGSGVMPMHLLVDAGVEVAVGADGAASNDNQSMFEALKLATLLQTLAGDHHDWPTAEAVWARSLRGGSAALGVPIGRLAPGALADIVLLDLDRHVVADREPLVASLTFAEHGESVDTVIVHGEIVIREGRSTRIDEADLGARARAVQRRLHDNVDQRVATYKQRQPALEQIEAAVANTPLAIERRLS